MMFLERKGSEEQPFPSSSQMDVMAGQPCRRTCAASVAEGVQRTDVAWAHLASCVPLLPLQQRRGHALVPSSAQELPRARNEHLTWAVGALTWGV